MGINIEFVHPRFNYVNSTIVSHEVIHYAISLTCVGLGKIPYA
jgi:hypothetical protein